MKLVQRQLTESCAYVQKTDNTFGTFNIRGD